MTEFMAEGDNAYGILGQSYEVGIAKNVLKVLSLQKKHKNVIIYII